VCVCVCEREREREWGKRNRDLVIGNKIAFSAIVCVFGKAELM